MSERSIPRGAVAVALATLVAVIAVAGTAAAAVSRQAAVDAARDYVHEQLNKMGLAASDAGELAVSSVVPSRDNGVSHVYLQQRYLGIDVYGAIANVNVGPGGRVLGAGNRLFTGLVAAAGGQTPRIAAAEAASAAAGALGLAPAGPFEVVADLGGAAQAAKLSPAGIASGPIDARLVWYPVGGALRLAWRLEIDEAGGAHWWYAFVDAGDGRWLAAEDLVVHDSARAIAAAVGRPDGLVAAALPAFPPTDGATYNVFPIPFESPSDGPRSVVANAADPAASPFGWHDTDGAAGAEFTVTRGNNVHAYADRDNNNAPDPGSDPDGGAGLVFDYPLDLDSRPLDSQPAMVTNLFYWNNLMHDVTYGYGFDEASGNFQQNNYGHGGLGADYVRAEAQDGSGRNNANFATPTDGNRPRMQMFEWRSSVPNPITVDPPSPIAGTYFGPMAGFGESLVTTGPIAGTVFLIDDGVGTVTDGCEPFPVPAGGIPLIDRGACNFTVKVKNAQVAGAAVAIVADNIPGEAPFGMGGADPTVVIPSVMISFEDGALFKGNLPLDATIADGTGGAPDRDSDIDAGVICHEYGHGVSNRLTGGPGVVNCLNNAEQMGEGWSDWFALNLTTDPADTPTTPRGVGTYVTFQPPDGVGIRPTQYTTDMTVNPSTYASVADVVNISQPHGIGYVWTSMLWEVYWNLVDRHGYNADVYGDWTTGGNNLALQLVMDGMKFQPCRPGFVDGRDAILAADVALTGGADRCEIWRGFAKRGLGASADQGSSNDRTDGVEAFDLPAACTAATFGGFKPPVFGPPAVNAAGAGSVVPVKFSLTDGGDFTIDTQPVDCDTLEITGEAPIAVASPGSTALKVKGDEFHLNWQTDPAWAGTCRKLTLRIPAAEDAVAYFSFH